MKYSFLIFPVAFLFFACANDEMKKSAVDSDSVKKESTKISKTDSMSGEEYHSLTTAIDTMIMGIKADSLRRVFSQNGILESEEYFMDSAEYFQAGSSLLRREYYSNGMLKEEFVGLIGSYSGPEWQKRYGVKGLPEYECHRYELNELSGTKDEFNHPFRMHEKYFDEGQLMSEGDIFCTSGESDYDSCGTWKFYKEGKLIRSKKFPSWQHEYVAAGGVLK